MGGADDKKNVGNWDRYLQQNQESWAPKDLPSPRYEDPPQIILIIKESPPPEWTPSYSPPPPQYIYSRPPGPLRTMFRLISIFVVSIIGNALFLGFLCALCAYTLPSEPSANVVLPYAICIMFSFGIPAMLIENPPRGFGYAELMTLLVAMVFNVLIVMFMGIAAKSAIVAARFG